MVEPGLIRCGRHTLRAGVRTLVMGILNATPDSFSGDGIGDDVDAAARRGKAMVAVGADLLDVGGESTRPGAESVPQEVELARVIPIVERLAAEVPVPISIDTRKAAVAELALSAGATIVNDVSGLDFDPRMAEVAASSGAAVVIGHWRTRLPSDPSDVIDWLARGLEESAGRAHVVGVGRSQIIADPGLGFAKPAAWSIEILRRLAELRAAVGLPILIGASRKSFIRHVLDLPAQERLEGSLAAATLAVAGGADVVRVHDVAQTVRAVRVADAAIRGWSDAPASWTPMYLGLGANLGDREHTISAAIRQLADNSEVRVIRRSALYETEPVGLTDQPSFLNTVLEAETTLPPQKVLQLLKRIERVLRRQPNGPRWGPRPIDLDILLYGDEQIDTPELQVPHPEMWRRLFVLAPLAELQPNLTAPDGRTLGEWVAQAGKTPAVRRL